MFTVTFDFLCHINTLTCLLTYCRHDRVAVRVHPSCSMNVVIKIVCTRCQILRLKHTIMSLHCSTRPTSWKKGDLPGTFKLRGGCRKGERTRRKREEGKEGREGEGKGGKGREGKGRLAIPILACFWCCSDAAYRLLSSTSIPLSLFRPSPKANTHTTIPQRAEG